VDIEGLPKAISQSSSHFGLRDKITKICQNQGRFSFREFFLFPVSKRLHKSQPEGFTQGPVLDFNEEKEFSSSWPLSLMQFFETLILSRQFPSFTFRKEIIKLLLCIF
jgi:hypothetical protein